MLGTALAESEKSLDRGQEAGGFVKAGLCGFGRPLGQVCLPFSDGPAYRFGQPRVGVEEMLHRIVTDFEDFRFFHGDDVGRAWLSCKECHLTEEISFSQDGNSSWAAPVGHLHCDAAVVHNEHRSTFLAGANQSFAWRKDMSGSGGCELAKLFRRK